MYKASTWKSKMNFDYTRSLAHQYCMLSKAIMNKLITMLNKSIIMSYLKYDIVIQ